MTIQTEKTGILITIEGIDGAGKSTLAQGLAQHLTQQQYPVLLTKEPGATPLGKQLRTIVQTQETALDPKAEYLLFAADRAQHFASLVVPHLKNNGIVISDRMADSSLVYQGYGRGLSKDMIAHINTWTMQNITPDITLYLRVPYATARERLSHRNQQLTAFEKEHETFLQRLIVGFDELLLNNPRCIVIDGTSTPESVTRLSIEKVMTWITKHAAR